MPTVTARSAIHACCPTVLRGTLARIESSEIGYRLAKGAFWSMAGAVISRGLTLVASIFVARMLGKTGYGELGMIQSTVGMFGVFAGFGLSLTATKHVAEFRRSDPARAGRIISLSWLVSAVSGGLMAAALLIFAPWLATHTINAPHLSGVLRIGSVMLFVSALNGAQTGALSGFEAFRTIAHVNLFVGLLSFPMLVGGAYVGGLNGAVWALAVNLGANWLLNHISLRREARRYSVPLSLADCVAESRILWQFSLPALLAGLMVGPVTWICSALLVNHPNGYAEMGIFSATNQWYAVLLFLPTLFAQVVLPILSERLGQSATEHAGKLLFLTMKINALVTFPVVAVASIASPWIMSFYGAGFKSGWPTLVVVLITAGLLAIQTPIGQMIAASGKMWTGFLMNMGWGLAFIVSTLLLVHSGAFGVATARAIAYVVHAAWTLGYAYLIIARMNRNGS